MNGNGEAGAVGRETINTDIVTLTRFLTEEQSKHKEATGDFTYAYHSRSLRNNTDLGVDSFATHSNSPSRASPTTFEELHSSTSESLICLTRRLANSSE